MEPLKTISSVTQDTIVAQATPVGHGGVSVIRVSGSLVEKISEKMLGQQLLPKRAQYLAFLSAEKEPIDKGIALFFKGPHSLTGEDVLELQGHGGPRVIDRLLQNVLHWGARMARPGEFLERAFLNNKIDLLQAEAVHDLIHANTEAAARAAMRSLQGVFSDRIHHLVDALIQLRIFVEAAIDFPEEELDLLKEAELQVRMQNLTQDLHQLLAEATQGAVLSEGLRVVFVGKPNAGKSSLLNCLCGVDVAIVTDIPGTTRDVLRQEISVEGLRIQLVDTAGLREAENCIEQEGIRRAQQEMRLADHVVFVVDVNDAETETEAEIKDSEKSVADIHNIPQNIPKTILYNKIDLQPQAQKNTSALPYKALYVSAKTGEGISEFKKHLKNSVGGFSGEGQFTARSRHVNALERVKIQLKYAEEKLGMPQSFALLAEDLRQAQLALDEITGKVTSDDLLGKIFSEFCIGK